MPDLALFEQFDQAVERMLAGSGPMPGAAAAVSSLMEIAGGLRNLPDDRFRTRLGRELQGIGRTESGAAELPLIFTITPFICAPDGAQLIEFMKHTFSAEESGRHPHGPNGFVAGMTIGDSDIVIMSGESLRGQECPGALHVYVKDCDATYRRALEAGAVPLGPGIGEPADRPYGERAAFVSDPFGNLWFIATRFGSDHVGAGLGHVTPSLLPSNAQIAPVIDFLQRAFEAKVDGHYEESGRLMHAFVRIGEAMVEMAESGEEGSRPFGFFLHTDDVDAVYHRAVAAGGTPYLPPADQPFGERLAIVADPAGNRWFVAKRIAGQSPPAQR